MGLETDKANPTPDDLNVNWPEGRDDIKFGDNHIRFIKKVIRTFWTNYKSRIRTLELRFTGEKAKAAVQADNANTLDNIDSSGFARTSGDYAGLRARATTQADVGLEKVPNWAAGTGVTDASASHFARAIDAKTAYDKGVEALTAAQAGGGIPGTTAIGSYMFAYRSDRGKINPGTTVAGSRLSAAGIFARAPDDKMARSSGRPLPGTWRLQGYGDTYQTSNLVSLFVRIS